MPLAFAVSNGPTLNRAISFFWRAQNVSSSLGPAQYDYSKEGIMQNLISYDPRTETGLDELFRGFFKPVRVEGAPTPVVIKMDVTETENGYLVHAEMPGVKKEDIDVAIEGNQVTITAEVKQAWEKKEGDRMLRNERYFGNIYRSFTLPVELDESACEATYDNGVLELKLVRKAAAPGKRLAIR
jgi:HSP20 family protein